MSCLAKQSVITIKPLSDLEAAAGWGGTEKPPITQLYNILKIK